MFTDKISMLHDTLSVFEKGYYIKNGKHIPLKLTRNEMHNVRVFLPDELNNLHAGLYHCKRFDEKCIYTCENTDSFTMARRVMSDISFRPSGEPESVLVLNFANPVEPGGGVRRGALAQEEDLCRKSSLLLSLEGDDAKKYYDYNRSLGTYLSSDAMIITPKVEIIKDENGELLDDSVVVSVMTCAAPMITYGLGRMTREQYHNMFYTRIKSILHCAAYLGYEYLVLGAFGCGAFGNDARPVSDMFYMALNEFRSIGNEKDAFRRVDFAVLARTKDTYNLEEFSRNFGKNGMINTF